MVKCPHCGAEVADLGEDLLFCPSCKKYVQMEAPRIARMGRFTFKVPKKSILLAVAFILAGGIYGFVQQYRQSSESSPSELVSSCTKTCVPTVGESESGREYCDCVCSGLVEHYPLDELEAFVKGAQTSQDPWSQAYSKFREVLHPCITRWKGPEYPKSIRQPFLDECSRDSGEAGLGYCECVIGQVERQYSLSEYLEISSKMEQNPAYVPPGFTTAVAACTQ